MKQYPMVRNDADLLRWAREVNAAREEDRRDWLNLPQTFVSGRKVGKIPTGSSDVAASDRAGDWNWDSAYLYYAVESGGSLVWRRIASASW